MRAPAAALPVLIALLAAQASAIGSLGDAVAFVTGLQAIPDAEANTILLVWDDAGGPYEVFRDGAPLALVGDASFLDRAPMPQATYTAVAVGSGPDAATESAVAIALYDRIALLSTSPGSVGCAPTGISVLDTPPFVAVMLHENCLPIIGDRVYVNGQLVGIDTPGDAHTPAFETR